MIMFSPRSCFLLLLTLFTSCVDSNSSDCRADVFILLDSSGSDWRNFELQRQFTWKLTRALDLSAERTHVGVMVFSGTQNSRTAIPLGLHDSSVLLRDINGLPHLRGTTSTGSALSKAYKSVRTRRRGVPLFVITVTDGFSWDHIQGPASRIRSLPRTQTFAAGILPRIDRSGLREITGSEENVFTSKDSWSTISKRITSCKTESAKSTQAPRKAAWRSWKATTRKKFSGFSKTTRQTTKKYWRHQTKLRTKFRWSSTTRATRNAWRSRTRKSSQRRNFATRKPSRKNWTPTGFSFRRKTQKQKHPAKTPQARQTTRPPFRISTRSSTDRWVPARRIAHRNSNWSHRSHSNARTSAPAQIIQKINPVPKIRWRKFDGNFREQTVSTTASSINAGNCRVTATLPDAFDYG